MRLCALILGFLVLAAGASPAGAETKVITVTDGAFDPPRLVAHKGDVVRWELGDGAPATLTLVSGLNPEDEDKGVFFLVELDRDRPFFEWVPQRNGNYPYFAAEQPDLMTASVVVEATTEVTRKTWGQLKNLFQDSSR